MHQPRSFASDRTRSYDPLSTHTLVLTCVPTRWFRRYVDPIPSIVTSLRRCSSASTKCPGLKLTLSTSSAWMIIVPEDHVTRETVKLSKRAMKELGSMESKLHNGILTVDETFRWYKRITRGTLMSSTYDWVAQAEQRRPSSEEVRSKQHN